jgi:hypothetical protein
MKNLDDDGIKIIRRLFAQLRTRTGSIFIEANVINHELFKYIITDKQN